MSRREIVARAISERPASAAPEALDALARAVATTPMRRRRAIALLGAGTVAVAASGVRSRAGWASDDIEPDPICWQSDAPERCRKACERRGLSYCGVNPYCSCVCCDPGDICCRLQGTELRATCCIPGREVCDPTAVAKAFACRDRCAGKTICGDECCEADEDCLTVGDRKRCRKKCLNGVDEDGNRITCLVWDPARRTCRDICPEGQRCDSRGVFGGGCKPKCNGGCHVWDPKRGMCRSACASWQVCDIRGLTTGGTPTCIDKCRLSCARWSPQLGICIDTCPRPGRCRGSASGGSCTCGPQETVCGDSCCPAGWHCHPTRGCTQQRWPEPRPTRRSEVADPDVVVRVGCPGPGACVGALEIVTIPRSGRGSAAAVSAPVVLGRRRFRIRARRTRDVRVPLSRTGRALLRRSGRLDVRAVTMTKDGVGEGRAFVLRAGR